jgi:hypothetical protein
VNRILRWFLAHDPTTACTWSDDEAAERFANIALRIRVAELEAHVAALDAENTELAVALGEAHVALWGKPERHLYAVETPLHDDLAVEQLRAQLDDEWFTRMQGWGNDAGDAS